MLLIPAIDLRNGRCVRLLKGDFGAETRYEHSSRTSCCGAIGRLGASWLHVVDLDGAKDGTLANRSHHRAPGLADGGEAPGRRRRALGRRDR